jgi:predicted amidohydrolase YtcJ
MSGHPRLYVADAVRSADGILGNALLVEEGRVAAVGEVSALRESPVVEERFAGATIVPGLRDAHFHPVAYTAAISGMSVRDVGSIPELVSRLRDRAAETSGPLVAMRLDDEALSERRLPTRDELDEAIADRPVAVHRYCGHIAVANSAALALAGIDARTADPEGGTIDRDGSGRPTGVLRETAVELVAARLSGSQPITPERLVEALTGLAGLGLTSLGAMLRPGDGPWASLGNEVELFVAAGRKVPIKVHAYVIANDRETLTHSKEQLDDAGARIRWAGVKRFSDGSLGGHTAALFEPYTDRPTEMGTDRIGPIDRELAVAAVELGGGAAIHAIGDRAGKATLDVFEAMIGGGVAPERLRLEHASVLTDDDIARIARLGVIASVQPAFLASEVDWLSKRLGDSRMERTYPFASLERAGAHLAGGSDCPVEPPHPLWGIAAARDRAGIVPEQGLSASSALRLFTDGAARALGEPPPLSVGSPADFVILDRDPVAATPDEVRSAEVLETVVDGEVVVVDHSQPVWLA